MPKAKTIKGYQASLVKFLSYIDGIPYPSDQVFSQDRLLEIHDTEFVRFVNWQAFHEEAPAVSEYSEV
jgi:hypothetical protein